MMNVRMMFITMFFLAQSSAKIKHNSLPFVQVEEYQGCLRGRGDAYCFVGAMLISPDLENLLYRGLEKHSAKKITHFNRLNIYRGICLSTSCQEYSSSNLTDTVEGCLNASLSSHYGLTTKVFKVLCEEYKATVQFDSIDYAFGTVVMALLAFNVLGSLYEFCGGGEHIFVGRLLVCFAVRRNWRRLVAHVSQAQQRRTEGLSAYRVFCTLGVIFTHTPMPFVITIQNPEYAEKFMKDAGAQIVFNSMHYVQIFYTISALLLAYNILLIEKKLTFGWKTLPKAIFSRWLRFTPVYALVLLFISSWMRHIGEGPFWKVTVDAETTDCRRDWWLHLLYIHNYFDNGSRCMLQSWHMPVELQLTMVGLAIFFILKSTTARQTAIALVVVLGLLIPGAATFFSDLDPVVITTPEKALNGYMDDPTFNNLYKRGHTNLVCYGLGLVLGYVVYHLRESDIGAHKYKKYRVLHWLLFPLSLAVCWTGGMFYADETRAPIYIRALYATAVKACFGLMICAHIFFTVVEVDRVRTRLYRWHGWTVLRRLTYCVYLIHMVVLSLFAGTTASMIHASIFGLCLVYLLVVSTCLLVALPLYLLAEEPCAQLVRLWLAPRHEKKHAD